MISRGMKISELIKILKIAKEEYGNIEVFISGQDYPGGVANVVYKNDGNGYVPGNCIVLYSRG